MQALKPLSRAFPSMAQGALRRPRRFAPLDPEKARGSSDAPRLKGIVFDVDGTLCEPQNYMFAQMREAVGIPKSSDILDHIHGLPSAAQEAAMAKIRAIESAAMKLQTPQPGLAELMSYLERRGVQKAICTRNFDEPVEHLLAKFLPAHSFSPIVTRAFRPPKPDPAGILHIAREWGLGDRGEGLVMVGDSVDDMSAGHRAGAATVLLVNEANEGLREHPHTDLCVARLDELVAVLEDGFLGVGEGTEEAVERPEGSGSDR